MKTPNFQLYRRSRLRSRLRNLVAWETERQYAIRKGDTPLEAQSVEAIAWQEKDILDYVFPTVNQRPKRGRE